MVRKWGLDVICLQETKMELITRAVIRSLCLGGGGGVNMLIGLI